MQKARGARVEPDGAAVGSSLANTPTRPNGLYARFGKPAIDRAGGLVLTLITLPVVLIAVIAIRATMGPKPLFVQDRVGELAKNADLSKFIL